jgi:hypothetical protein
MNFVAGAPEMMMKPYPRKGNHIGLAEETAGLYITFYLERYSYTLYPASLSARAFRESRPNTLA